MKKNIHKYSIFILALFLSSCANIVSPTGGPKDVTPPVVLKTFPENFSKEFKEKSVKIDFDEYVKIMDATSQLIVSPFMKVPPVLKIKGKSIVMDFKDTLKPNTTYSVSFGKAIADNNEGNVLLNYRYVFSTGKIIDTLTLKGIVKNAFTLKPEKGIFVFLYDNIFDSVPYKETPLYLSKTNEDGTFAFENVKNGKYKLFALKDGNNNFLFDPPSEMIAYCDSFVIPEQPEAKADTSKKSKTDSTIIDKQKKIKLDTLKTDSLKKNKIYNLSLFEENPALQKLLKVSATKYGNVTIVFRKPVEDLIITPLTKNLPASWNLQEMNITKDTVMLWLKNPDMDSLILKISDNNIISDTAEIALIKKNTEQKIKGRGSENRIVGIKTCVSNNGTFDFYKHFLMKCSSPIDEFNYKKIILTENKDTIKANYSFADSIKRLVNIDYKWKEKTTYNLFIPPGTFKDIFNRLNDTVKIKFTTTSLSDYGNIKIKIKPSEAKSNYIIQLVSEGDVVIQEKFSELNESLQFNNISPGNYKIKLIYDKNNNKKWDTGNYLKNIQPEKVKYYPSTIIVKSNWDLDLDWDMIKK